MTLKAPGPRASCSSLSWSARYYIAGACKQYGAQRRWRRQYSACSCHCRRRRAVRHCRRHSAVRRRRRRCCSPRSFFLSSLEWLCKCSSRDARWPLPSPHSTVSKLFGLQIPMKCWLYGHECILVSNEVGNPLFGIFRAACKLSFR